MEFRPCIDIHNGKVKQIIGSSLKDKGDSAYDNFVSSKDAAFYADLYKKDSLKGAHVIILNSKDSEYYEESKAQAFGALSSYKNALQIGGGVNDPGDTFMRGEMAPMTSIVTPSGPRSFVCSFARSRSAASFWISRIRRCSPSGASSVRIFQIRSVVIL